MTKTKKTYHSILFRHILVFTFLILLVANPVVNSILVIDSDSHEWFNDLDKETSEEKEITLDFEDENIQYYLKNQFAFYSETSRIHLYFNSRNALPSFNLDILLPPPELL